MKNISLFYCFIFCVFFLVLNVAKIGLRNKTFILPSTFFALIWGVSTLGIFLFSNGIIDVNDYYKQAEHLECIGNYQIQVFISIFLSFICVRVRYRNNPAYFSSEFLAADITTIRERFRSVYYLFFIIGLVRLFIVISAVGFDYANIRSFYVENRINFSSFDVNLVRVASYLMQFAQFYVCLLGIESAIKGINYKQIVTNLLLFCPYQMSFGGRLFILSFFMPFLFSYFLVTSLSSFTREFKLQQSRKIRIFVLSPFFLLIFFQILKMDSNLDLDSFSEFSTEIFYTSSAYRHMNEFWDQLPNNYQLGVGSNILGLSSDIYNRILNTWSNTNNSALVCVPSMIPQMILDFGKYGSLFIYFVIFYNLEKIAIISLTNMSLKQVFIIVLTCLISYQTAASSMSDIFKSFIIGYLIILIIVRSLKRET